LVAIKMEYVAGDARAAWSDFGFYREAGRRGGDQEDLGLETRNLPVLVQPR
jgi:general stress protein YciG